MEVKVIDLAHMLVAVCVGEDDVEGGVAAKGAIL